MKLRHALTASLALLCAPMMLATSASAAQIPGTWNNNCPDGLPYSYAETADPNGATVRRFELHEGDQAPGDVAKADGRQRCEMKLHGPFPMRTPIWFAYSFRIEGELPSTWVTISQLHQSPEAGEPSGKPPAFLMRFQDGQLQFLTRSDTRTETTTQVPEVLRYSRPAFPADQWQNIVVRANFDPFGAGSFTVWINGAKEYVSGPIPLGYNDLEGPEFAHGQYRGASPLTTALHFANVEIGTTSLADRVITPKPLP